MRKKIILILIAFIFTVLLLADSGNRPRFWYEDLEQNQVWTVDEDGTSVNTDSLNLNIIVLDSLDARIVTVDTLNVADSVFIGGSFNLTATKTGGANISNMFRMNLGSGETFTGTTGNQFKVYDVDNTVVHDGGEHCGVYVNMKQLSAMASGGKSVLFSGHNYGSGGDYQIIDAGVWLYGNLVDAFKVSGGSIETGLDLSETTITGEEILGSNGENLENLTNGYWTTDGGFIGSSFDTNIAAAGVVLSGTTLEADGTDANIDILVLPKATGTISVAGTTTYETNVTDDDDIPNKKYVDDLVTAQDLDFAGDAGTGAVDLDSQVFTLAGTANEVETSAGVQTITIGLPNSVSITSTLDAEQLTSNDDALVKDTFILGDDVNNTSGKLTMIASDGDTGDIDITTGDALTFTGFGGGIDVDGDLTAGTISSDAGVTATTTIQGEQLTSTDDGLIKDKLIVGDDVNNTSGSIELIAEDGDAGTFAISTSDALAINGFGGGISIDTSFGIASHLYMPLENDATTPTINFGDDGDGMYSSADGYVDFATNAARRMFITDTGMTFTDQGSSVNSLKLSMVADDSGTTQTSEIYTAYGTNPYMVLAPPDAGGTPTSTLNIRTDLLSFVDGYILSTQTSDDDNVLFEAVDNDDNTLYEVARLTGAVDPTFDLLKARLTGSLNANSQTITSAGAYDGTSVTLTSNIQMANSVSFQARDNADSAYDNLFNYNSSDEIEFEQPVSLGSIQGVTDGGMQLLANVPVSASATVDSKQGQYVQAGSSTVLSWGGEALDAGGVDKPFVNVDGALVQETNVIRKMVSLTGATDATATEIFTITTTDETAADGGAYSVHIHILGTETVASTTAANASAISLTAHWTRLMLAGGTGATSAVAEISESAANDLGTGAISAITITTAETSEFISSVLLDINTSGGTFDGYAIVELVYNGFLTPPIISD